MDKRMLPIEDWEVSREEAIAALVEKLGFSREQALRVIELVELARPGKVWSCGD